MTTKSWTIELDDDGLRSLAWLMADPVGYWRSMSLWSHALAYWMMGTPVAWVEGPCWPTAWTWPA